MESNTLTLNSPLFPQILRNIPAPPKKLFVCGPLSDLLERPRVAIVGSRSMTAYGDQVTSTIARELAERGVVIISGLALGVDATAQKAAVQAGGLAIAVLPSPLENIVPSTNRRLAQQILDGGGALVSEYAPGDVAYKQNFVARNRLMSGLADVVLITEAALKSGSLHTARFAQEQGKTVMALPGNVTSPASEGANNLLRQGASLVTSYSDVLHELNLKDHHLKLRAVKGRTQHEQLLLDLMLKGVNRGEVLLERSGLSISEFNRALVMLEMSNKIRPLGGNQWVLH